MHQLSPQQVIALIARLGALWLVVETIPYIVGMLFVYDYPENALPIIGVTIAVGVPFAIAIALWFFPLTLAFKLLPPGSVDTSQKLDSENSLYSVGFVLLGSYFFVSGFLDAFHSLMELYRFGTPDEQTLLTVMSRFPISGLITAIAQLIVGAVLVIRAKSIAALISRLRYAS